MNASTVEHARCPLHTYESERPIDQSGFTAGKKRLSLLTAAESVSLTSRTCNSEGRRGVDVGRTSASGERGEGNYRFWPVQCKDKCGKHACPRGPYFWLRMHVIKQAIKAYNYNQLGTAISWLNFRARLI